MKYVGDLLALLLAVAAAHILGAYRGRRSERHRIFKQYGVRTASELRRAGQIETDLRRSLRMRLKPEDPENRPRQYQARTSRR